MSAFTLPFDEDLSNIQFVSELTIDLPDPHDPSAPTVLPGDPITRPGIARYAGSRLVLLHVQPDNGPYDLFSPATGTVRLVDLDAGVLNGTTKLLEIEPLPFQISSVLEKLPSGSPTFYLAYSGGPPGTMVDDDLVAANSLIDSVSGDAYVGAIFQDGLTLAPWAWIDILGRAMNDAGDDGGAAAWLALKSLYDPASRVVRVLAHTGRPVSSGLSFNVSVDGQAPELATTEANGDLPLSDTGVVTLSWNGDPIEGDAPQPVLSLYENILQSPANGSLSAAPGGSVTLPPGFERGHLQVVDLSRWTALPPAGSIAARFHTNSRLEPLLDGVASFRRIVDDLVASRGPNGSAYFSGLIFNDFQLVEGRPHPPDAGASFDTSLIELTNYIRDGGGEVRMQFDKFLQLKEGEAFLDNTKRLAIMTLLLSTSGVGLIASLSDKFRDNFPADEIGVSFLVVQPLIAGLFLSLVTTSTLESIIEPSHDLFGSLNDIEEHIAIWARHPVQMLDNPLADRDLLPVPGLKVEDIQDRFGSWHQKIQAIRRVQADSAGNTIIGYLGGIDINKNRLDSPGHQAAGPYHDVHARVTGTAAWDVHQTWRERYEFEKQQHATIDGDDTVPDLAVPLPDYQTTPALYPAQPQKHIVQIGRTYPPLSSGPLSFSPFGEKVTYETMLRALKEAREYIYLEDQYFTPNTSPDVDKTPGNRDPEVFFDVLLDAAETCKRLVITVTREGDQPFGQHRRAFLMGKLRDAWDSRIFIGVPLRRPFLVDPGRVAAKGRAILLENISHLQTEFIVGPRVRIPNNTPFWLWIYGELMLCTEHANDKDENDAPAKRLTVVRGADPGGDPRWGATTRAHKKGAPVTLAQLKGPYVHAKVMMVDDLFVGIGSTNLTRRAFFHEGEIHAFAVPEQLKAAPDNPARALRTALWAEHLGLPPAMGPALLGDPMAAFEYFRRPIFAGNRSTPVDTVNELPYIASSIDPGEDSILGVLKDFFGIVPSAIVTPFWNTFSDATTTIDPRPTPGPFA